MSCASVTLPDGTKLESKGKAQAVIIVPRDTWSNIVIPESGHVVSELKDSGIPGCPFLKRTYQDADSVIIKEEYVHTCEKAYVAKSEITLFDFLTYLIGIWGAMGFPT